MTIAEVVTRDTTEDAYEHLADVVVTPERVHAFAEATRDFNPIHFDNEVARKFNLDGVIAHGGLITGIVSQVMFERFGDGVMPRRIGETKFLLPVYTGSRISIFSRVTRERCNVKMVDVEVRADGNVVLVLKDIMLLVP
ncbi:hypothetical protein CL652_02690 [bacterium]|nr:hypothetical protein [bacterium]|tara:strand:+ start:17759 stop:18175 length:417 start_codon:yes stop_codon:yes gene_type:complete